MDSCSILGVKKKKKRELILFTVAENCLFAAFEQSGGKNGGFRVVEGTEVAQKEREKQHSPQQQGDMVPWSPLWSEGSGGLNPAASHLPSPPASALRASWAIFWVFQALFFGISWLLPHRKGMRVSAPSWLRSC